MVGNIENVILGKEWMLVIIYISGGEGALG